jgi:hypothetical protein
MFTCIFRLPAQVDPNSGYALGPDFPIDKIKAIPEPIPYPSSLAFGPEPFLCLDVL